MNRKRVINILIVALIIIFILVIGYFMMTKKIPPVTIFTPVPTSTSVSTSTVTPGTAIEYQNTQYGFSFSLPGSWTGYSIISSNWEGYPLDVVDGQTIKGPEILIRHPLWTTETPRQDIPIMIFTPAQWSLVQQEKLSLGAAPIGPSELGQNSNYVFALPARYNFAFPIGFEEVENILSDKPLSAF
jgi:hypothetical protein